MRRKNTIPKIGGITLNHTSGISNVAENLMKVDCVDTYSMPSSSLPIGKSIDIHIRKIPRFLSMLDACGYDYLLLPTHDVMQQINPRMYNMDIIPLVHDLYRSPDQSILEKLGFNLNKRNLQKCTRAVTVSPQTKADLEELNPSIDVNVIAPGVDPNKFYPDLSDPTDIKLPEKYILYVGAFAPRKNTSFLLKVLEELPKEYMLVIAGSHNKESRKSKFMDQVCMRNLYNRVFMTGRLSIADLRRTYSNAEVYIHPAKKGGMELTPMEAAACGTPVVMNPDGVPSAKYIQESSTFFEKYDGKIVSEQILGAGKHPSDYSVRTWDDARSEFTDFLCSL